METTYFKTLQRSVLESDHGEPLALAEKVLNMGNPGFSRTVPEPLISVPTWYEAPWRLKGFKKRVSCADACKDLGIKCLHKGAQAEVL